jgi:hypothetical protein
MRLLGAQNAIGLKSDHFQYQRVFVGKVMIKL